jgi:hypothetical protein
MSAYDKFHLILFLEADNKLEIVLSFQLINESNSPSYFELIKTLL